MLRAIASDQTLDAVFACGVLRYRKRLSDGRVVLFRVTAPRLPDEESGK